eukprot:CAMPEP_0174231244 /NCGR_PEP_ID=MMETSP0417-20130205/1807_1 /TAXON_ID=242541 /ORGANISM="Mayorella sp, Strain BSH-02190019" /LENGTH=195 /DNA_ID=CAMNT_0015309091 /DNA_START=79 /DNA_END=666 /DNA_ORIENTATION=-
MSSPDSEVPAPQKASRRKIQEQYAEKAASGEFSLFYNTEHQQRKRELLKQDPEALRKETESYLKFGEEVEPGIRHKVDGLGVMHVSIDMLPEDEVIAHRLFRNIGLVSLAGTSAFGMLTRTQPHLRGWRKGVFLFGGFLLSTVGGAAALIPPAVEDLIQNDSPLARYVRHDLEMRGLRKQQQTMNQMDQNVQEVE